jgi:AcrR family transcriptional regulator
MHTVSMDVKGQRAAQGRATRDALVAAARDLFGRRGYADTSTEDIVAAAGVTKGALYHHYGSKQDIFRVVFEQVKHEISDQVAKVFMEPDAWTALTGGCEAVVDAQLDPAVRRIVLYDARSVLGWEIVRDVDNRYGAVALRGALRKAMRAGVIREEPLRPLALLLTGALSEACFYVADADDPEMARAEVGAVVLTMLEAFRLGRERDGTV